MCPPSSTTCYLTALLIPSILGLPREPDRSSASPCSSPVNVGNGQVTPAVRVYPEGVEEELRPQSWGFSSFIMRDEFGEPR